MSWLFSQVLVEEYLGDISSDGEQSVQSNGNPTQLAYCAPDKMTVFSRLSRFGMTYKPLTEDRGEALLMSYLAAFPVRTSLPQEKEQGLTESEAECGEKWRGSFTRYDHDSCSWKTHQCSLLGDLTAFSETWPRWGSMRNGECWERQTLELRTNETEFGLWPTPRALEIDESYEGYIKRMKASGNPKNIGKTRPQNLSMAVKMWGTPKAQDSRHARFDRNKGNLGEQVAGLHDGGQLNPNWVEWLMGWPVGWTDLKPLEMDKFQKWQDEHSQS